jgi:hypothetical protein
MYLRRVLKELTAPWPRHVCHSDEITPSPGKGYRPRVAPLSGEPAPAPTGPGQYRFRLAVVGKLLGEYAYCLVHPANGITR